MNNKKSKFGKFGGQYVPETVMTALKDLEEEFEKCKKDKDFILEFKKLLDEYVGRPSMLYFAKKMTDDLGGAKIYLKREDLNHTGAHKINNVLGQILLAKKMGKKKIIAETGAGQHGVATATVASLMDMECVVYMGEVDIKRQSYNVNKMRLLGTKVIPVTTGSKTLKDATNEAIRKWVQQVEDSFYVIGSVVGPHPYPKMVKFFQKVIGEEVKEQILKLENRLPDEIIACVGGGSNAIGIFTEFIKNKKVSLTGIEAGGLGLDTKSHGSVFKEKKLGVFHGMKTYLLQNKEGHIKEAYSISAGLDYPGIGPEHAFLESINRVKYQSVTDKEAVNAYKYLSKIEGIIPALESSHAIAYALKTVPEMDKDKIVVINLSGRGDKDLDQILEYKEA